MEKREFSFYKSVEGWERLWYGQTKILIRCIGTSLIKLETSWFVLLVMQCLRMDELQRKEIFIGSKFWSQVTGLNQVTKALLAEYQGNTVYHMVGVGSERESIIFVCM